MQIENNTTGNRGDFVPARDFRPSKGDGWLEFLGMKCSLLLHLSTGLRVREIKGVKRVYFIGFYFTVIHFIIYIDINIIY